MHRRAALLRDLAREFRLARASRALHAPRPPTTGLVLEVGGGQQPAERSNILVDKYVADDSERAGGRPMTFGRPLVVADGEALPFEDGMFAYSIAYHVLEHARAPDRFARELSRVSSAGSVQVPSRAAELMFGWPFHPWLVDVVDGTLHFASKDPRLAPCNPTAHDWFAQSGALRLAVQAHESLLHHTVHWTGDLAVHVEGFRGVENHALFDLEQTCHVLRAAARDGRTVPLSAGLVKALIDPVTRRPLIQEGNWLVEPDEGRRYVIAGDVPILVCEEAS